MMPFSLLHVESVVTCWGWMELVSIEAVSAVQCGQSRVSKNHGVSVTTFEHLEVAFPVMDWVAMHAPMLALGSCIVQQTVHV